MSHYFFFFLSKLIYMYMYWKSEVWIAKWLNSVQKVILKSLTRASKLATAKIKIAFRESRQIRFFQDANF